MTHRQAPGTIRAFLLHIFLERTVMRRLMARLLAFAVVVMAATAPAVAQSLEKSRLSIGVGGKSLI